MESGYLILTSNSDGRELDVRALVSQATERGASVAEWLSDVAADLYQARFPDSMLVEFRHHGASYLFDTVSEVLADERTDTVIEFWRRATTFFAHAGITIEQVMTDNGPAYRSHAFNAELGTIRHRFTRPYRPQTNGKVERFNRILATEWAYATTYDSDDARSATYAAWLLHYNHHRPTPASADQPPQNASTTSWGTTARTRCAGQPADTTDTYAGRATRGGRRALLPCCQVNFTRLRRRAGVRYFVWKELASWHLRRAPSQ